MAPPLTRDLARARWQRRFWPTFFGIFVIDTSYPIAMLLILHGNVFEHPRNDLACSFHSLFLVPIAFGLLATAYNSKFFMGIDVSHLLLCISFFLLFIILLSSTFSVHTHMFPPP